MSAIRIDQEMNTILSFQEFFQNSRRITKNWGISLRNRKARAQQGGELATELLRKVAEFETLVASRFWTEEGNIIYVIKKSFFKFFSAIFDF
jgi:hypothetical protein